MIHGACFAPVELKATLLGSLHAAVRLGGAVLALATCMAASPILLAVLGLILMFALAWTGLGPQRQIAALKPWAPVALLVVVIHTLTTTTAAPLGHPSTAGAMAGGRALLRVACSVGCLGLYLRVTPLDDLVTGVGWWLRPFDRLGLRTDDLGLMLAVAMGTVPVVMGEGRRIEAVVSMRSTGPAGAGGSGRTSRPQAWLENAMNRARVVVPLLESLARRAEALTLSLRFRRPDPVAAGPVPVGQLLPLVLWAACLVWYAALGGREVLP